MTLAISFSLQKTGLPENISLAMFTYLCADTRETKRKLDHIRKNGLKQMLGLCIFKNLFKREKIDLFMKNNFKKISEITVQNKFVKTGSIQKKWKEKNRFY